MEIKLELFVNAFSLVIIVKTTLKCNPNINVKL